MFQGEDTQSRNMESFIGKVVIVTGGNSGIGEGIALKFASLGSKICIAGRKADNLERAAVRCREAGTSTTEVITVCGDIRDETHRADVIAKTLEKFGQIDVLVNNAGILHAKYVAQTTQEEYSDIFDTNVKACIFLAQLAIPHLKKTKGCIVNNSSIAAVQPLCSIGVYSMSKAALNMFTKCLALDLGPSGVRVNSINPGITESRIFKRGGLSDPGVDQYYQRQATRNALGRVALPSDCAEAVAFLASDAARHVTGQHLYVDGGRHCVALDVD